MFTRYNYAEILNLKKKVGIAITSKEQVAMYIAMYLNQLEILSYVTIMHQPVTISSNTCSQMHVQYK